VRDSIFHHQERTGQVGVQHLLPDAHVRIDDGFRNAHRGIIDGDVQPSAKGSRRLNHALYVFQLADVRNANSDLAGGKTPCEFLQLFAAPSRDADLRALADKRFRNGSSNARAASGDQCDFARQSHASLLGSQFPVPR
jgi:hypothetical protein